MKKRFTEEQIIQILKEQKAGERTVEICHGHGISQPTFYKWKAKYEIDLWRQQHNKVRPHNALDYISPEEFARQAAQQQSYRRSGTGSWERSAPLIVNNDCEATDTRFK